MSLADLKNNLENVEKSISQFEAIYDREKNDVCLIAVSKTRSSDEILQLASCGQTHFGENYLQEAVDKITNISDKELTWHFIGPIQKNKTKQIAEHFSWVHSIDRDIIATRLNDQRTDSRPPLNVCIQVNIDNEASKSGIEPDKLLELASFIEQLPNLQLKGLMAIPSTQTTFESQCKSFNSLTRMLNLLKTHGYDVDTLSMGMSNDYEAAIACGSTMVRIGTALFGPRNYS